MAKRKRKTLYYCRVWLNKPKWMTNAALIGYVEENDPEPMLRISDCNRVIDFYLRKSSKKEQANSLYKMDVLVRHLIAFRLALYQSWGVEAPEL